MHGYWGDEARTREAVDADAGWMHTGDLATMDAEGYVNIVGRIKDMVIRGGENVYPREIEVPAAIPVSDVQVIGVPDAKYGEEICAWVVRRPGPRPPTDDLRAFCRGQIAHYKVPPLHPLRWLPDDHHRQDPEPGQRTLQTQGFRLDGAVAARGRGALGARRPISALASVTWAW